MLAPRRAWVRPSGQPDYVVACSIAAMLQHEGPHLPLLPSQLELGLTHNQLYVRAADLSCW